MAGPFDFLNMGGAPTHPDPVAAEASKSTNPWLRMFGLGTTPEDAAAGRVRLNQLKEQEVSARLSAKAAELSRTATDRADLAKQLLMDPVGMEAITTLPHEQIKSTFDTVLSNLMPDMETGTIPQNQVLYGMKPGASNAVPLGQGGYEATTQNPVGEPMSTQSIPGQIFGPQPTQPQKPFAQPPSPGPQGSMAPQMPMPQGFAMTTPQVLSPPPKPPSAPAAMEPGTIPSTVYEANIAAEGTALRGDPYNEVLAYGKWGTPSRPLTQMTLAEVKKFGRDMRLAQAKTGIPWEKTSSAVGAHQILATSTMEDAQRALGIPDSAVFSEDVQRRMHDWVLKTQGWGAWEGYKANPQALAQAQAAVGEEPAAQPTAMQGPRDVLETATAGLPPVIRDADLGVMAEANPAFYFLGAGLVPWVNRGVGRAGRQFDTKDGNISGSLAGARAKAYQARLNHAVMTTREGREDMREGTALSNLVPNFGVGNDPVAALSEGISLYDYATKKREAALQTYNDPRNSKTIKEDANRHMVGWGNVLGELPKREDMEALQAQLLSDPHTVIESKVGHPLMTPGQMWRVLTNEGPVALGAAMRDPTQAGYSEGSPPDVEAMDLPTLQTMEPDAVRSWVQNTDNATKSKLPPDVQRAIIAKLKAAGSVQPQR